MSGLKGLYNEHKRLIILILTYSFLSILSILIFLSHCTYHIVLFMIALCFIGRLLVGSLEQECWFIYLLLVSLIGGLIISFVYIVRLCPNYFLGPEKGKIIIIFISSLCLLFIPLQDLIGQAERINFSRLLFREVFIILIFALLIILILTDRVIIPLKGSIRRLS